MRLTLSTTDAGTDAAARTVTGTLAVFGPVGNGSIGPVRFEAGSITLPTDPKRVKLLIEHDTERPVGYLTESAATDQSVTGTFYLPPGESGNQAIQEAKDGLRDGLSVGLDIRGYHKDGEVIVVTESLLREVSLVAVPALDDARVTSVSATRQESEGTVPKITTEEAAPVAVETERAEQPQTTALPVVNASRNPQPITARCGSMDLAAAISTASEVLTTRKSEGPPSAPNQRLRWWYLSGTGRLGFPSGRSPPPAARRIRPAAPATAWQTASRCRPGRRRTRSGRAGRRLPGLWYRTSACAYQDLSGRCGGARHATASSLVMEG